MRRCPGYARHWYAVPGAVGLRSPNCIRCCHPNPRPLSEDERRDFDDFRESIQSSNPSLYLTLTVVPR